MNPLTTRRVALILLVLSILILSGACHKKPRLPRLPPPEPKKAAAAHSAPVVTLSTSATTIRPGQSITLSWEAKNADSLVIDGDIGSVGLTGSRELTPKATVSYTAMATGPGGTASATAKITVIDAGAGAAPSPGASTPADVSLNSEALFDQNIRDIFFEYDKFELSPEAIDILYSNANFLRQFPSVNILIEGHCDERGTAEYNLALGDRRAKVTKDFLVGIGITPERISTISYGEERPFDPGQAEEAWSKNRRAHFVFVRP